LNYPVIYASARSGWAVNDMSKPREGVNDLLDAIVDYVPYPKVDLAGDFQMLISQTESNKYFGKMLIGRVK
jgi:GTP-binding protein